MQITMDIYKNMLHSNYTSLVQLCNDNPSYNHFCQDDNFWRDKISYQIGPELLDTKPSHLSWYEYYLSQYKTISLFNENHQHVANLLALKSSTVGEMIKSGIEMLGYPLDGNYGINFYIGPYKMYSSDLDNNWYQRLGNLGVLGYLHKDNNLASNYPNLHDRTNIWSVIDQAAIEIIPLTLRTQSKVQHSYIKLSSGRMLGSEHFRNQSQL